MMTATTTMEAAVAPTNLRVLALIDRLPSSYPRMSSIA
jgi:hypothetical protein